jgi:hypothetical protein
MMAAVIIETRYPAKHELIDLNWSRTTRSLPLAASWVQCGQKTGAPIFGHSLRMTFVMTFVACVSG